MRGRFTTEDLPSFALGVCQLHGWNGWEGRAAYLHLEASELVEAWRGKRGTRAAMVGEAADVLFVFSSILGSAGIGWREVLLALAEKHVAGAVDPEQVGP